MPRVRLPSAVRLRFGDNDNSTSGTLLGGQHAKHFYFKRHTEEEEDEEEAEAVAVE